MLRYLGIVEERTNELYIEKKKSDDLLLNILPEVVAQDRERIADFDRQIAALEVQLDRVRKLKGGQ